MRLAVAVLADAVNVRENMLNMLSAGVTRVSPPAYPAPLGVDLAMMIELGKEDLLADGHIEIGIRVLDEDGEELTIARGAMGWEASEDSSAYVPTPVQLSHVELPGPGVFVVEIAVADLEKVSLSVTAQVAATETR